MKKTPKRVRDAELYLWYREVPGTGGPHVLPALVFDQLAAKLERSRVWPALGTSQVAIFDTEMEALEAAIAAGLEQ